MKMYILIKEDIPEGFAIVGAAHASLAAYLKFSEEPEVKEWISGINGPFYKVICKVGDLEFEKAKELEKHVIITESRLGNEEVAIAFMPREEWPKSFKFFRLWK